ncbi:methyl-accepting chemotaxis protein [Bowmanella dokdonensis]|uniref:Methyl-accepting chemotaxis protein n=1 Tax=Bowmanella dokdonensis TaxID=751969 RepID=A0A939DRL5_9ALTE|nr:methyl-accepting chemotaxis protein [Bowmanella dokdonensis]MBN7827469.1 methyl-accepting chemotaxis protein [Bowmanella dokdonensis]
MTLNDLTIRTKFSIPLLAVSILVVLVSILSMNNGKRLSADAHLLSTTFISAIDTGLNADRDLYQALTASQNYVTKKSLGLGQTAQDQKDFNENAQQALDRMNRVRALMEGYPEIAEVNRDFDEDYQAWFRSAKQVFTLADSGNVAEAATFNSTEVMSNFNRLRNHYDVTGARIKEVADRITSEAKAAGDRQRNILIVVTLLVIIACVASMVWGPKLVTTRVHELDTMIATISEGEGDLRGRLDSSGKDELSKLAGTFNNLMNKLQQLISMIKGDTETLDKAVVKLNDSARESEQISSEQNNNLDQIATAVNQLTHAVHEVANNSQTALGETRQAKDKASQSGVVVDESISSINKLSSAVTHASQVISKLADESKSIVKVLDVIRGIAEQTNLLALNAAIEAARAGEQGRGFAVVADEVRTLASRTQQSTEDIQRMIVGLENGVTEAVNAMTTGTSQVDNVVEMSRRIQESLDQVDAAITQTNDMIYQIATATEEQSQVVDEINRNVTVLNSLSQQSVSVVRNTKKVSDDIAHMASGLNENVGRFKV